MVSTVEPKKRTRNAHLYTICVYNTDLQLIWDMRSVE
jgi:hypothetical protein